MSTEEKPANNSRVPVRTLVRRVRIRNFKSIKSLDLELEPGVNVLVGANASGKTNILEAIHFLYRALIESMGKIPYRPHAPEYWSPTHIIYKKNPENPVVLGVDIEYYWTRKGVKEKNEAEWLVSLISMDVTFVYDAEMDTIMPVEYKLSLNKDTTIRLTNEGVEVRLSKKLIKEIEEATRHPRPEEDTEFTKRLHEVLVRILEVYEEQGDSLICKANWQTKPPKPLSPYLFLFITPDRKSQQARFMIQWIHFPNLEKGILLVNRLYYRKTREPSGVDLGFHAFGLPLAQHIGIVERILERIILLKHPDTDFLSEPVPFYGSDRLDVRARNLAELLLALQGKIGGFPERLHRALSRVFPGVDLRVESRFGRVALVGVEDGLPLPPANLPDGLVKLVALMVAVEQNPSILLVDELENSMHARLLEFVVDELNSLGAPVLVATHSPIVVDLVGPERILIVEKHPDKGTVVKRVSDQRELLQRLREEGIALSDHVFYSATWRD